MEAERGDERLDLLVRHAVELQPDEHAPVGRAVVAVVEQRDVAARADAGQEVEQRTGTLREAKAVQPLAGRGAWPPIM